MKLINYLGLLFLITFCMISCRNDYEDYFVDKFYFIDEVIYAQENLNMQKCFNSRFLVFRKDKTVSVPSVFTSIVTKGKYKINVEERIVNIYGLKECCYNREFSYKLDGDKIKLLTPSMRIIAHKVDITEERARFDPFENFLDTVSIESRECKTFRERICKCPPDSRGF